MSYPKDELPAPDAVHADAQAFELARLWFANGTTQLAARANLWPDPAAWGVLLGEMARHVASMYAEADGHDAAATLARIRAGLDTELGGDQA